MAFQHIGKSWDHKDDLYERIDRDRIIKLITIFFAYKPQSNPSPSSVYRRFERVVNVHREKTYYSFNVSQTKCRERNFFLMDHIL